ncbi:hypothetical protein RhiirC2_844122 [Rhizophagus irregularis]|uniref:Uncharacterized protein n=1 Tax=Rhizophagus irregularis TaxID=588596 RepID=A0A2N1NUZ1_9GLOM|nr:hypothetical protein RhiirC2_844122 [Rhizophagus irregularis]
MYFEKDFECNISFYCLIPYQTYVHLLLTNVYLKKDVLADSCKRTDNQDNDHKESFDDSRKYNKKDSRRTNFHQYYHHWKIKQAACSAKVLIKDKEKETVDSLEKKQTNDSNTKKEESSYKKGKDK